MSRPRKPRMIREDVPVRLFKPQGVPMRDLQGILLTLDALEALRLADAEGLEHVAAAELMGVSRSTFSRLLAEARTTVATALSKGWAIRIDGGPCCMAAELTPGNEEAPDACRGRELKRRRGHCERWGAAVPLSDSDKRNNQEGADDKP